MSVALPPSALLGLDDDDFRALVDADIQGKLPEPARSVLRDPTLADRWWNALVDAQKMIEATFRLRKADYDRLRERTWRTQDQQTFRRARDDYQSWHARTLWAHRCLQLRLAEAKVIRRTAHVGGIVPGWDAVAPRREKRALRYGHALAAIAALDDSCPLEDARRLARAALAAEDEA